MGELCSEQEKLTAPTVCDMLTVLRGGDVGRVWCSIEDQGGEGRYENQWERVPHRLVVSEPLCVIVRVN